MKTELEQPWSDWVSHATGVTKPEEYRLRLPSDPEPTILLASSSTAGTVPTTTGGLEAVDTGVIQCVLDWT